MWNNYEPLKITARLRTGIVADRWLPLDGILFYQAHRHALGPENATIPGGNPQSHKVNIPLRCINTGTDNWFFACSWASPQPWWSEQGSDAWNKRFDNEFSDMVDFGKRRGKVIIEQGRYKSYHMPVYYYAALQIEWYCIGNKSGIETLLSTVTHIGKKAVQGWGRVITWEVVEWPHDWSCYGPNNEYMRGMPLIEGEAARPGNIIQYGIRPSYYRRENQRMLMVSA